MVPDFSLNSSTGSLSVSKDLIGVAGQRFELVVRAEDSGGVTSPTFFKTHRNNGKPRKDQLGLPQILS